MSYAVKTVYYTLQGEGAHTGRPAVLLRFAGCNLWSGQEHDRATAVCQFCDTDFVGMDGPAGGSYATSEDLVSVVAAQWPSRARGQRYVVCTGGEPLLQLDPPLLDQLHTYGFAVAIESNGTIAVPNGVDWICVSPKGGAPLVQTQGDELKLVYPQDGAEPERYERFDFRYLYLQPMDGPHLIRNTELAVRYCLEHPHWRLSLQTHKLLGIP